MNSVSVIKIAIMVLAYRDAENGRLNLEERYLLRPQDKRRGSGVLQVFADGRKKGTVYPVPFFLPSAYTGCSWDGQQE